MANLKLKSIPGLRIGDDSPLLKKAREGLKSKPALRASRVLKSRS